MKTAPSLLLAQPLKTRRLSLIRHCFPVPVFYLLKSLSTEDIEQVLTQAMEDKTRGYGGQDIVLPDETRRAIAELVNATRAGR
ncbi:putative ATPase [Escherichia coli]|uniref:Putative ATPase n=1 Tax=Escherichia coli TaxID=562 RepID=A0A377AUK9_ECOLX|nr:putative ATPase [Escherichia coli]